MIYFYDFFERFILYIVANVRGALTAPKCRIIYRIFGAVTASCTRSAKLNADNGFTSSSAQRMSISMNRLFIQSISR